MAYCTPNIFGPFPKKKKKKKKKKMWLQPPPMKNSAGWGVGGQN
jgi:hypothetical protein